MSPPLEPRDWVFLRKARRTAEQALFFLFHVEDVHQQILDTPTGSTRRTKALEEARAYVLDALEQMSSLIYSVHVSRRYLAPVATAAAAAIPAPPTPTPELPPAPVQIAVWRDCVWEHVNSLRDLRRKLEAAPSAGAPLTNGNATAGPPAELPQPLADVLVAAGKLAEALRRFIDQAQPRTREARVLAVVDEAKRAVSRRLTFGIGAIAVCGLFFGVEPIRALITNQGAWALLPLAGGVLPLFMFLRWPSRRLKLDWGRHAFSSRYTAEPDAPIARWPAGNSFTYRTTRDATIGLLLLMASYGLVGLVLWASFAHGRAHGSFLTVFISLALAGTALRVCVFLDRWDFIDERPVRFRTFAAAAVIVLLVLLEWFVPLAILLSAIGVYIYRTLAGRKAPTRLKVGVVVLTVFSVVSALRSYTSRNANAWRNEPLADMGPGRVQHWPMGPSTDPVVVLSASGGGSRAAIYTAKTLMALNGQSFKDIGQRLQAISSVSGGSLASAVYIARLLRHEDVADIEDAVSNDFLLPTLLGALNPLSSRGIELEDYWRAAGTGTPAMGDLKMSDLASAWSAAVAAGKTVPPFPMPLFNTCSLDAHDVVVTPLSRDLYTESSGARWQRLRTAYGLQPSDLPTWVVDRDAIYGLEDLLPKANVSLVSAVRASANFPFGFPLVVVETCSDRLFLAPARDIPAAEAAARQSAADGAEHCPHRAHMHLTDGGVLSNSGMWSLFQLLTRGDTFTTLSKRGVLLILVEASKMPEYEDNRRSLLSLYGTIGDKNPVAQNLHRTMFSMLRKLYDKRLAIVQLDLVPRAKPDSYNVCTTWALDPKSQQKLTDSFQHVWRTAGPLIRKDFDDLKANREPTPRDLVRPPLD